MANTRTDTVSTQHVTVLTTAQSQAQPAGFSAPNTPPNGTERVAQFLVFAINNKDK